MGKKKEPTIKQLENELLSDYARWSHIYHFGCSDPFWEDGTNINLVRNHIIYHKGQIEKLLGDKYYLYPDCYFFPKPIELPNDFMAVDRYMPGKRAVVPSNKTLLYSEVLKFDWSDLQ